MSLKIRLIGEPSVRDEATEAYRPRSRKSWALLCYLLLSERPPSRSRLGSLLFAEADDPLRALRWNLAEVRRLIGPEARVEGNPVTLILPKRTVVDVERVLHGDWSDALDMPIIGSELLEGFDGIGSPEFELWLLAQRRRVAASAEAMLHEAALVLLGRGEYDRAIPMAQSLVASNAYDESHQALLIRAYTMAGDSEAAKQQMSACTRLFAEELGVAPGPAVRAAALARFEPQVAGADFAAVEAVIEAGSAAMAAGAPEAGVLSLRSGVALADTLEDAQLRATSRISLADALVHAVRGEDEEGALLLHEAELIASDAGESDLQAQATAELGFIDMLGARYDRAEYWLDQARALTSDPAIVARAASYLGVVESDRANYDRSHEILVLAEDGAGAAGDTRRRAYATSMLGRLCLLQGKLESAVDHLGRAVAWAQDENWLSFLPWPQAFLGEALLEMGDTDSARQVLEQAFARACQVGDPCWEGVSGRGLALLSEAEGETTLAFDILLDARKRCVRLSDTYMWGEAYILEAQCALGVTHEHERVREWIEALYDLSSRTGMRELTVRAMTYESRLDGDDTLAAVENLAAEIPNPRLHEFVSPLGR
ncbi:MAG: BTAD domain-containing putative transcriptional regulator [Acidimicrobiia bacterium]